MKRGLQSYQKKYLLLLALMLLSLILLILGFLGAYQLPFLAEPSQESNPAAAEATQNQFAGTTPDVSQTPSPSPSLTPTSNPTPTITPVQILGPEPTLVKFQAADGQQLSGLYYPGAENPSPVIVLMHWTRGDQQEWEPIARWLQGRGMLEREPDYNRSWKSADRFPERELDFSLGVFTFNFRGCDGECQSYQPAGWLLDAQAAVQTAAGLQGADHDQILTAGASIGADGSVSSCAWMNRSESGICRGSLALSPASLLTEPFQSVASELIPGSPVYCLYGLRDDASVDTCESLSELVAINYGYTDDHGLELIQAGQNPDPLNVMQEFIREALGEIQ